MAIDDQSCTCYFIHFLFIAIMLLWSCASAQEPGFLSIDCGSNATGNYTDDNGIEWVSDTNYIKGGTAMQLSNESNNWLSSMRLFDDKNQSKYCYILDVQEGDYFLLRAGFWAGMTPPYTPQNASDGYLRFKLIVDADEWVDVQIDYGSTAGWSSREVYVRARRSSIDVCLARNSPNGDAPFISSLELRPLPPTLSSTSTMKVINDPMLIAVGLHTDYGVLSSGNLYTRYPSDALDRLWVSFVDDDPDETTTTTTEIDVSTQVDRLPVRILQNAHTWMPGFTIWWTHLKQASVSSLLGANLPAVLDPNNQYWVEFFFAEIDPAVNASRLRTFDIKANDELLTKDKGPIDVFAAVGANSAYAFGKVVTPNAAGRLDFHFTASPDSSTSKFYPFIAAAALFRVKPHTPLSSDLIVIAVEEIKSSLNLSRFRGDPCLPIGYGYSWLTCSPTPEITALRLSQYNTGGPIPKAINSLTTLSEVYLDGNGLQGQIPDLSRLFNLQHLDLSNNKLNGSIPNFLGELKNLKLLYVQNNNLSGVIPKALLERKQSAELVFEFSGNKLLCESNLDASCSSPISNPPISHPPISNPPISNSPIYTQTKKTSSTRILIGSTVSGILLVISFASGFAVHHRFRRGMKAPSTMGRPDGPQIHKSPNPGIKLSVQEFSFQEIRDATDNFSTRIGQGGFGLVYKGCLQNGCFVAIKVAYDFSHQGPKEFFNEVHFQRFLPFHGLHACGFWLMLQKALSTCIILVILLSFIEI